VLLVCFVEGFIVYTQYQVCGVGSSYVTVIDTDMEITILEENRTESILRCFEASVTLFRYCIAPEGPAIGDGAGGHIMGFTPPMSLNMPSVEEFIRSH